ncbi:hypothetical protein [Vibrio cholerae]|uniref:hypothetical protein n=1 Tax=Vibrio cholerae TaxID=666 RepID=UPI00301AD3B9|nr:hypothetical protein [Vibrio cholerae]
MNIYNNIIKIIKVMCTRGGGALIALISTVFIVRNFGEGDSGQYFTLVAYSLFLVTIITFGGNQSILKQTKYNENAIDVIYNHVRLTAIFFIFTSPPIIICGYFFLDISVLKLCLISFCALTYSISQQMHYCCIAKEKQEISYLLHAWLPNTLILISAFLNSIDFLYISYILGYFVSSLMQAWVIFKHDAFLNKKTACNNELYSRTYFFQQDVIGQVFSSLVIIISSLFMYSSDISQLTIYIKISSVCNIMISVVNISAYPSLRKEIINGKESLARKNLRIYSLLGVASVLIYSAVIVTFWSNIRNWFNVDSLPLFLIFPLLFSYTVAALSSVRQMLLNTFGYERVVKNYSWIVFFLGMIFLVIGAEFYSVKGVLIALSNTVLLQALFNIGYYKKYIK